MKHRNYIAGLSIAVLVMSVNGMGAVTANAAEETSIWD